MSSVEVPAMRNAVFVVIGALVVFLLLVEFSGFGSLGGGHFPLALVVISEDGPPKTVSCQVHGEERQAKWAAQQTQLFGEVERVTTADPFDGRPLEMSVSCDSQVSPILGRTIGWWQSEWLVVLAVWGDGRRVAKVVHIPDGRTTRTVRVELP